LLSPLTGPLPLELANSVEQLKPRVFTGGDEEVGTAGHEHESMRITELTADLFLPHSRAAAIPLDQMRSRPEIAGELKISPSIVQKVLKSAKVAGAAVALGAEQR
jgi:hypothetical protein